MATAIDFTSFDAALKDYYLKNMRLQQLTYRDNPAWGLMPKVRVYGRRSVFAVQYANPTGSSADFATAKTNATAGKFEDFLVTRKLRYSFLYLDRHTILSSSSKEGAFDEATSQIDRALANHGNDLAIQSYRNHGGARGRISSETTLASTTLKLATPDDAHNFVVGQILKLSTADGTSGAVKSGSITVTGVDLDSGELTTSGNISTGIASAAHNDYIFVEGDFGECLTGWDTWVGGSPTTIFGVDRSVDTRLLGQVHTATGQEVREALIKATVKAGRLGGRPNYAFIAYNKWQELLLGLESTKEGMVEVSNNELKKAGIGYGAVSVLCGNRPVKVLPDGNCPNNTAFLVNIDDWQVQHAGSAPITIVDEDTGRMLRAADSDSFEVRIASYDQIACKNPAGQVKLSW